MQWPDRAECSRLPVCWLLGCVEAGAMVLCDVTVKDEHFVLQQLLTVLC